MEKIESIPHCALEKIVPGVDIRNEVLATLLGKKCPDKELSDLREEQHDTLFLDMQIPIDIVEDELMPILDTKEGTPKFIRSEVIKSLPEWVLMGIYEKKFSHQNKST